VIEDTTAYALLKAMKASRRTIGPVLAESNVYPGQDLLLSALWRQDGIAQSELVARLGIEAPTVSKALQRLERVGYVRREAGRGRARRVYLTEEGRALRHRVEGAWNDADQWLCDQVGEADAATLRRILQRITQAN
jgi:DNA-binding MarR family transcriptional regulator